MTDTPPAGRAPRVVKRYSNRKLYDTLESRYVTLTQIAELVRNGEEVHIVDNTTKEDLTRMTLAQILYEEERKQSRTLPLAALKDLLHTSGERIITSLRGSPVGKLIARDSDAASAADTVAEAAPEPEPAAPEPDAHDDRGGRVAQFVEQSRGAIDHLQQRVDDQIRAFWEGINPASQIQALQAEVKRLHGRVEQLEAALAAAPPSGESPRE